MVNRQRVELAVIQGISHITTEKTKHDETFFTGHESGNKEFGLLCHLLKTDTTFTKLVMKCKYQQ